MLILNNVWEVFVYFLKLGCTGFGGPVALVAVMQAEIVEEKKWMDPESFRRVLPLIKAMPGAFAFQTACYLGVQKAGRWGGFVAGLGLILPASIMMVILGEFLTAYGELEYVKILIEGFQWSAIALIFGALKGLTQTYQKQILFWILVLASVLALGFNLFSEISLIVILGVFSFLIETKLKNANKMSMAIVAVPAASKAMSEASLIKIFWICFKSGAFVFGTGLAIAPLLENDFVIQNPWLSHNEFMTALALGQLTPGPVLVTVTMLGYKVFGVLGAAVATVGVFLPGLIHMLTWFPSVSKKVTEMKSIQSFLMGALAAIIGAILITIINLIRSGHNQLIGIEIAILCLLLTFKWKWSSWQVILFGGFAYVCSIKLLNIF